MARKKTIAKKLKKPAAPTADVVTGSVPIPGFLSLTRSSWQVLWDFRKITLKFVLVFWLFLVLIVGPTQQAQFEAIQQNIDTLVGKGGVTTVLVSIGIGFLTIATGGLNGALSESQQIYTGLAYVLVWLVAIWLLRHLFAGRRVKLRDALYNGSSPLLSSSAVVFVGILQLIPATIAGLLFSAVASGNLGFSFGASLLSYIIIAGLIAVSIHLIVPTILAAIIVTNPGKYPIESLRLARKLVKGVRLKVLLRVAGLAVVITAIFGLVLLPALALDKAIDFQLLPFVSVATQFATVVSLLFGSTYLYVLYRKLVDGRTQS